MDLQTTLAEAWSAYKTSYSSTAPELVDFEVEQDPSKNTRGFLSDVISLTRKVKVGQQQVEQTKLKVKKISEVDFRRKLAIDMGVYEQEIGFFEKCVPILLRSCPELPVVKCYKASSRNRMMILEDLNEHGYFNVVYKLIDLHDGNLHFEHIALAMKTVAKFHVASLGVDWADKCPDLYQHDLFYERGGAVHAKNVIKNSVNTTMLPAARFLFPENQQILKSIEWLASDECYQVLTSLSKADPKCINVLNHGDCWASNFLFKTDLETGKPVDAKMIDFQICRYAPISRDLLHFFYISTRYEFRKLHEPELIRLYAEAFNENCIKMDRCERLTFEQIWSEYNRSRLLGLIQAIQMSPISHVQGVFKFNTKGRATDESTACYLKSGVHVDAVTEEICRNYEFKQELCSMIEEIDSICTTLYSASRG